MTVSHYPTPPNPGWQTLTEFALPSEPGNDHQAATQVAEAVRHLNLPTAHLERLKTAVAKATLNAIEQGHRHQPDLPVVIRVLVSGKLGLLEGGDASIFRPDTPDLVAKPTAPPPRGWSFFLIEKMIDEMRVSGDDAHHTIELFLYLEGGKNEHPAEP